ncbi:TetR/AcrR family transcriptional regulator [Allorhizobium sp. BGMRC 0089]|uniref:TetR/AcrR family transcriptional regulator n=1 Tax=Allorhizobium sonneratiae TaxID=2934936 RepID=UPI0020342816|nr:TetR/AcrR family transcriptional regulator [Allorhizobium sonneratiae]MCM2290787.1 TetR/AcrR family transcriptional regulator [Allorhizobium sonneratiae]
MNEEGFPPLQRQDTRCQQATGRFAAGEDPAKRIQILEGAKRAFMTFGYDATSMNDITREAGVSKGTLYVYFANKEDLFAALIEHHKLGFTSTLRTILTDDGDMKETLRRYGATFAHHIVESDMMPALRVLLGVSERMPGLCKNFIRTGPENVRSVLMNYLALQAEKGALVVPDPELAAQQFIDLSTATFFKQRLFGQHEKPTQDEIDRMVDSALDVFLTYYARR